MSSIDNQIRNESVNRCISIMNLRSHRRTDWVIALEIKIYSNIPLTTEIYSQSQKQYKNENRQEMIKTN